MCISLPSRLPVRICLVLGATDCSDRRSTYQTLPLNQGQICWGSLKRDFQAMDAWARLGW